MTYRYTEQELKDIQARQAVNLANFERNSGRGLPSQTVRAMEKAQGVKLDDHGAALPVPLPQKRTKKRKSVKAAPLPVIQGAELAAVKALARGAHPISTDRPTVVGPPPGSNLRAPSIARYRKRAECDGILFDSTLEMRRYKELKLLKAAHQIAYFLRQVPFHLPGGISARIDFMVVYVAVGGSRAHIIEFEDCKAGAGKRSKGRYNDADRVGVNKRKQIKALYGVEVKLVTKARA